MKNHYDSSLQNRFTAYLITAVRNRKINYSRQKHFLDAIEIPLEKYIHSVESLSEEDMLTGLPIIDQIEDFMLQHALSHTKGPYLYILFARILEGRSFAEIAMDLGMNLKTVTSAYYRLITRLKKELRGDRK